MDELFKGFTYNDFPLQLATLLTIASKAEATFKALPKEEQERMRRERAEREEHNRVEWFIHQGKCPYCGQKLIRGKKDKKNGYKRTWECVRCDETLSL